LIRIAEKQRQILIRVYDKTPKVNVFVFTICE